MRLCIFLFLALGIETYEQYTTCITQIKKKPNNNTYLTISEDEIQTFFN